MYTYTNMQPDVILKILKRYGLDDPVIQSIKKGYRNTSVHATSSGSGYNLMLYKRELNMLTTIKNLNSVGLHIHSQGFPARYPINSRILRVFASEPPLYAGIYNYLGGSTIPWEGYTRKHLVAIGQAQGNMHAHLRVYEWTDDLPRIHETLLRLLDDIEEYTAQSGVISAMSTKLKIGIMPNTFAQGSKVINVLSRSSFQQTLHMDFVRGNVLFDENAVVTGVIDFEKVSYGHPLFDVARTLAFLYVDCMHKQPSEVLRAFLERGYQKRSTAQLPQVIHDNKIRTNEVLEQLVTVFLLHDFYKFLLHNPYESLGENAHYVRTRDELIRRGVLVLN